MEVKRYKMIYTKKIRIESEDELPYNLEKLINIENENDNIRLLGKDFVKNNKK